MAWALLSPLLSLQTCAFRLNNQRTHVSYRAIRRKVTITRAKATENEGNNSKEQESPTFNPFGFVTDNPSSRSAIQLPESPAEDGNVGQMLYRIEDKGKENGSYIKSGKLVWFVRETGSPQSRRGTVVFLHGAPTQSYSYRVVMSQMSDAGFHCFAPDWIGFGFSDKPQPGYGFDYTEKEFHEELDKLLDVLDVKSPFFLVTQVCTNLLNLLN
uniref:Hydrolase n=1 Tax=Rhizophora mucronata TaxID=61149 RepID=A0A2P2LNK2_RHIMU